MEDKELHPVVQLLLARMKSHPEEFWDEYLLSEVSPVYGPGRWDSALRAIQNNASEQDLAALNEALGAIRMEQIHNAVLDELLNGEERRRKEHERVEQDRQRYAQAQIAQAQRPYAQNMSTALKQQMDYQAQQAINQLSALGKYGVSTDLANDSLLIRNHDTRDTVAIPRDELATASSPLTTIKKALGLK